MNLLRFSVGLGLVAMVGIAAAQGDISYERHNRLALGNFMKMRGQGPMSANIGRIGYDTSDDGNAWNLALTHLEDRMGNGQGAWALTGKFSRLSPDAGDEVNQFLVNFDYQINSDAATEAIQYGLTAAYARTEDLATVWAIGPMVSTVIGRETENPFDLAFTAAYTNVDVDDVGDDSDWVMDVYGGVNVDRIRLDADFSFESDLTESGWFVRAAIPVSMDNTQFVRLAAAKHEVFRLEYGIRF